MTGPPAIHPNRTTPGWWLLAILSLLAIVFAVHGVSLTYGLFMDDHAHFRQLQECGWSFSELTAACRLELVGEIAEVWWLPETTLRFFRPVAFGIMKLTYVISDWNPTFAHFASLFWHSLTCVLLLILLRRLVNSLWLAWVVAGLFAVHPGHLATVAWIACQTELMVATFLLGATLCIAHYRGWPGLERPSANPPSHAWAVAAAILFILALGCRENAIMFPFVIASVELLVWRKRTKSAITLYAVLLVLVAGYLLIRTAALGGVKLPPKPYVIPPGDPAFPRFIIDKMLYYLLGEYAFVPTVPIAGLPYLQAHPVWFYSFAIPVVALVIYMTVKYFRRPPGPLGPVWVVGFLVPLLPVFASPHHLYLPGIGWAITAALIIRDLNHAARRATGSLKRIARPALWIGVFLLAGALGAWTVYSGLAFETGQNVEQRMVDEILSAPEALEDGDVLYVANLPLIAHYLRLILEREGDLKDLRVIPLTWAPRMLGAVTPAELSWVNDRIIDVRIAEDRFFTGAMRRLAVESTGGPIPDVVDRRDDLGFLVRVLEHDERGIAALRFEFVEPPTEGRLHLFWGSRARWAFQVNQRCMTGTTTRSSQPSGP